MQLYHHKLAWLLGCLWLCCSCIEDFNAELPSTQTTYLVVEGSICGNSECEFILSRSLSLSYSSQEFLDRMITNATVNVCSSDGSKQSVKHAGQGVYLVKLGTLDPSKEYWLEVEWEGNTFASDPTLPISTPKVESVMFEQPRPDQLVDILITPEGPSGNETQYFLWSYKEDWEIRTPLKSDWDYDLANDSVIAAPYLTNQGWCSDSRHTSIIGNNKDFVNGHIRNLKLYDAEHLDNRFNYLYRTTIRQRAISHEEYEYQQLSLRQSDEMGGLFTPQPSELPTNIHCKDGARKAIGYVGVNANVAIAELYVRGDDVGYQLNRRAQEPSEDLLATSSNSDLYRQDFRIREYVPQIGSISWIERWAVDCTVWGAKLFARPEGWPNERNEIPSVKKDK